MNPETPTTTPGAGAETGETPEPGERATPYGFDLDPGEEISRIIHRSIFDFLPTLIFASITLIVGIALIYLAARFAGTFAFPRGLVLVLGALLVALGVIIFLVGYIVFRRNVMIFTTAHLVEVEQNSLFSHRVSQISFARVQDASGVKVGFLQTIFNFGNVEIQSAGAEEKFIFRNAPDPQGIADEALEIHERCLRELHMDEPE
jgi:uncharacterized membrane protein YdbT with pleckstrin-like domain